MPATWLSCIYIYFFPHAVYFRYEHSSRAHLVIGILSAAPVEHFDPEWPNCRHSCGWQGKRPCRAGGWRRQTAILVQQTLADQYQLRVSACVSAGPVQPLLHLLRADAPPHAWLEDAVTRPWRRASRMRRGAAAPRGARVLPALPERIRAAAWHRRVAAGVPGVSGAVGRAVLVLRHGPVDLAFSESLPPASGAELSGGSGGFPEVLVAGGRGDRKTRIPTLSAGTTAWMYAAAPAEARVVVRLAGDRGPPRSGSSEPGGLGRRADLCSPAGAMLGASPPGGLSAAPTGPCSPFLGSTLGLVSQIGTVSWEVTLDSYLKYGATQLVSPHLL